MDLNNIPKTYTDSNNDTNVIVFQRVESDFDLPLRIKDFTAVKEKTKFIKSVEHLVRYSPEYKYWVKYITEAMGNTRCVLTDENLYECNIDIHHHPVGLYDICGSVIDDYMGKDEGFCSYDIAIKVITLHYQNRIGYIPLLSDLHCKHHNGFLDLPIEFVQGDYKYMLENYEFTDKIMEVISSRIQITKEDFQHKWNKEDYPGLHSEIAV